MYAISKLNKQHEQTWINLQKRLNDVQFVYASLFQSQSVYDFIKNKAISVGSCEGYFVPSLLTTTAFTLASNGARVDSTTHKQPVNIYTIFVGYPGTGKSSAIQYCAQEPLENIDMGDAIISQTTSSGLVKILANNKKGMVLSPEVFDVLNKLLKSDEDNGTGDVQLLCKLFSGEKCSYHFSTENTRVIQQNTPFSILGSTQLVNAAKLIAKMDHGHGLVDRILFATPLAYRPTLSEMEAAKDSLTTEVTSDFNELYQRISAIENDIVFSFDANAKRLLRDTMDQFVGDVNEAISEGKIPPKSKEPELIPRIATALHVLHHFLEELLAGLPPSAPPTTISHTTLENAIAFVKHLESQKDILSQFLKQITNAVCDNTIEQPTQDMIKDTILLSPGPVVSYRSFKHSKRSARSIAEPEYTKATTSLQQDGFGRQIEFRVPRATGSCKVFVKSKPDNWPSTTSVNREKFDSVFGKPVHRDFSASMKQYLQTNGHL